MRRFILFTAAFSIALGQPGDLQIEGVTSTQAIISYAPPGAGACLVEVSESPVFATLVHDIDAALFPGSNSDTGRAIGLDRRRFIVGTRTSELGSDGKMYSRALRADTQHYVRVTCGSAGTTSFVTAQIHGLAPEAMPFNPDGFGNFGFPSGDLKNSRSTPMIDPQTGAASWMITNPRDYSHVGDYTFEAGRYFQGSSWTNPQNITAANSGTTASTNTANAPIFIPARPQAATVNGNWHASFNGDGILTDLGLHLYGRGTDGNAANRQINVCLSVDSGQSCYTNSVTVTMPSSAGDVGTFPATFPVPGQPNPTWEPFVGWGKVIPRNYIAKGTLSGSAGALSFSAVPGPGQGQTIPWAWFNPEWAAGSKIKVTGSSPVCADDYCTIQSVLNSTSLTVNESYTSANGPVGEWAVNNGGTGYASGMQVVVHGSGGCVMVYEVAGVSSGAVTQLGMVRNDTDCSVESDLSSAVAGPATSVSYMSGGGTGWTTGQEAAGQGCAGAFGPVVIVTASGGAITGISSIQYPGQGCTAAQEGNMTFTGAGASFVANVDLNLPAASGLSVNHTAVHTVFEFAGLGFRIVKTTGVGTVHVSASYKIAKSYQLSAGPENGCSPATVTTNVDRAGNPISRGIVGRLCIFESLYNGNSALYFVGETEPEFRLLSLGRLPDAPSGYPSSDWIYTPIVRFPRTTTMFDTVDPRVMYIGMNTADGSPSIFKGTYSGDFREASGLFFKAGNDTGVYAYVNDGISWQNLTRKSQGQDPRTRILASSGYNETLFGSLNSLRFVGIADNHAIFYKAMAGQDDACWVFVLDARTGAYRNSWNTLTGGGAEGAKFGGCHAIGSSINRIFIGNNGLRRGSASTLYGGPFQATPTQVSKGGSPSTNTALPGIYDGSYDGMCPTDIAQKWKDRGATGNHCVTLRFSTEPCSNFATNTEKAATPCPGDATKSYIGVNVGPGDELFDPAALGGFDSEHLVVVKRTELGGNVFEVVLLRDAGNGYCCLVSQQKTQGECAQGLDSQAAHANGWVAYFVPQGSCGSVSQFVSPTNPEDLVYEHQMFQRGHFSYEMPSPSTISNIGVGAGAYLARNNAATTELGKFNGLRIASSPSFNAVSLNQAVVQSYVSPGLAGIGTDWRHINGGTGANVEIPSQTIGPNLTIASVAGQVSTWKVSGFAAPSVKLQPMMIWAGVFNLDDMSSAATGNLISDANPWKYCYSYRANECRTGAAAGDLYVVVPHLESSVTQCHASQVARRILCVFPAGPGMAQVTQLDVSQEDARGMRQRRLGPNNSSPGAQYVYSHSRPFSATQRTKILATQYHVNGLWTGAALVDPGGWNTSSQPGNDFVKVPIQVPALAGANQARIRFGYADYGAAGVEFHCTGRNEDCVTDSNVGPFAFVGDVLTPTACAAGCTIPLPVLPGRIAIYRVEWLNSGTPLPSDDVRVIAVP